MAVTMVKAGRNQSLEREPEPLQAHELRVSPLGQEVGGRVYGGEYFRDELKHFEDGEGAGN